MGAALELLETAHSPGAVVEMQELYRSAPRGGQSADVP